MVPHDIRSVQSGTYVGLPIETMVCVIITIILLTITHISGTGVSKPTSFPSQRESSHGQHGQHEHGQHDRGQHVACQGYAPVLRRALNVSEYITREFRS